MSSVTRSQRVLKHEQLTQRATNFVTTIPQAEDIWRVCFQVLKDNPPEATPDSNFVIDSISASMPEINSILMSQFIKSLMYPVALLRDVANFFGSFGMPADLIEGLRD